MSGLDIKARHYSERPAPRENFADGGRTDRFYRFSVKCNRAENDRIAKMAAKQGMTPTEFVQVHFEQLLVNGYEHQQQPEVKPEPSKPAQKKPVDHKDYVGRLYNYMEALADKQGRLTLRMDIARRDLACGYGYLTHALQMLLLQDKVEKLTEASTAHAATYKIKGWANG